MTPTFSAAGEERQPAYFSTGLGEIGTKPSSPAASPHEGDQLNSLKSFGEEIIQDTGIDLASFLSQTQQLLVSLSNWSLLVAKMHRGPYENLITEQSY